MEKEIFIDHLERATQNCLANARKLVVDTLPDSVRFVMPPLIGENHNPLVRDQEVYDDFQWGKTNLHGEIDTSAVIDLLWRNGKVLEWINMTFVRADEDFTYLQVYCMSRFTEKHFRRLDGIEPFISLGVCRPKSWNGGSSDMGKLEKIGKFKLSDRENVKY